jgi:hypothetical protein
MTYPFSIPTSMMLSDSSFSPITAQTSWFCSREKQKYMQLLEIRVYRVYIVQGNHPNRPYRTPGPSIIRPSLGLSITFHLKSLQVFSEFCLYILMPNDWFVIMLDLHTQINISESHSEGAPRVVTRQDYLCPASTDERLT